MVEVANAQNTTAVWRLSMFPKNNLSCEESISKMSIIKISSIISVIFSPNIKTVAENDITTEQIFHNVWTVKKELQALK